MRIDTDAIRKHAADLSRAFTSHERQPGDKIRVLKDDAKGWAQPIVHACHGDMMPDDLRYEMIETVADAIAEADDDADVTDFHELGIEAPIYTHELTAWLNSRADRSGYCDEAAEELGGDVERLTDRIALGWLQEAREIHGQMIDALSGLDDDEEEE